MGEFKQVIVVRMPPSLHLRLKEVAYRKRISLNRLCVLALDSLARKELPSDENKEPYQIGSGED